MFKCQNCQTIVPAHTKAQRIVVEIRHKVYPKRKEAFWTVRHGSHLLIDDVGGEGWEIAREIVVCPDCAAKMK